MKNTEKLKSRMFEALSRRLKYFHSTFMERRFEYAKQQRDKFIGIRNLITDSDYQNTITTEQRQELYRSYNSVECQSCVHKGRWEYLLKELNDSDEYFKASIKKLVDRAFKYAPDLKNFSIESSYLDPNLSLVIDLKNGYFITANTIIASGPVQRPHYRYLIYHKKTPL